MKTDRTCVGLVTEFGLLRGMDTGQDVGQVAVTDNVTHHITPVIEALLVENVVHLLTG